VAFLAETRNSAGAKDAVLVPSGRFSGENLPLSGDNLPLFYSFGVKIHFFPMKHKLQKPFFGEYPRREGWESHILYLLAGSEEPP